MHRSVMYWVTAAYRKNEPEIAKDELPARALQRSMKRLARRWEKNIDEVAPKLAAHFARSTLTRSDKALERILRNGGMTVKFTLSKPMRDVLQAKIAENVSLIRSIPSQYFTQIEGKVMRSVQRGRDLSELVPDLQKQYGVTRRRAALIARDQNNKATSAYQVARQTSLGLEEGIWMHSGGGQHPRPKHVAANGKKFKLSEGLPVGDKGQKVLPGEEINCKCVWRPVIPGLT
ncbi:MAG: phage head morphogenesis protein [Alphaproteobacteria bacterium]|nr:phage head morphogenesis protein [Alphaproteobacteria bacterium]